MSFGIFGESINYWKRVGDTVFGFGSGIAGILVGAGYIVGIQVAVSIILGSLVAWGICAPMEGNLLAEGDQPLVLILLKNFITQPFLPPNLPPNDRLRLA